MKARISNLAKTQAEWSKINFVPMLGELIIYIPDKDYKYARLKVGDGTHALDELPFIIEAITNESIAADNHQEVSDPGRIMD
jgi:hypothetical protein